ncbi:MAG: MarR family transcriptional regulator [Holosporales bacterium]|jgi:DNA-binding MarR family transcriptional regulator|nr:MarR family transcriptional regulator [Holosporales bacterium]
MKTLYYDIANCIERSYKLFLDLIKYELDRVKIYDINNVQALVLYNIADQEVSVGELTSRGMYQGSNVSYNLKKLIQAGYIVQTPSEHDKRSLHVRLSEKGRQVYDFIDKCISEQSEEFKTMFPNMKSLSLVHKHLQILEIFWSQQSARK